MNECEQLRVVKASTLEYLTKSEEDGYSILRFDQQFKEASCVPSSLSFPLGIDVHNFHSDRLWID